MTVKARFWNMAHKTVTCVSERDRDGEREKGIETQKRRGWQRSVGGRERGSEREREREKRKRERGQNRSFRSFGTRLSVSCRWFPGGLIM
jgi:hypothetical protein